MIFFFLLLFRLVVGRLATALGDAESAPPTEPIGRPLAGLGSLLSLGREQRCKFPETGQPLQNQILKSGQIKSECIFHLRPTTFGGL